MKNIQDSLKICWRLAVALDSMLLMRKTLSLPTVMWALSFASCVPSLEVGGSGNAITESRNVSDFNSVRLMGSGQLTIDVTGTESLTIKADDNLLPYLTSEVNGKQLTLGTK